MRAAVLKLVWKHVKKFRKRLYALKQKEQIVFVPGIGKRKSPLQKSIEMLEEYLERRKGYHQKPIYLLGYLAFHIITITFESNVVA